MKNKYDELISYINDFDSIIIFSHINPDADSIGSELALKRAIQLNFSNKNVYALGSEIFEYNDFLGEMDEVEDEIIKNSLGIIVCCSDLTKIEDERFNLCRSLIIIDHQKNYLDLNFDCLNYINSNFTSTSELLLNIFESLDFYLDVNIANSLFLALASASECFNYSKDYAFTFSSASKLALLGAQVENILNILHSTNENELSFKGYVYTHYQVSPGGVIYLIIDASTLLDYDLTSSEVVKFINLLSNVESYPVWAFFIECYDHSMNVELRSEVINVRDIATKYGGGGNIFSSNAEFPIFSNDIIFKIIEDVDKII